MPGADIEFAESKVATISPADDEEAIENGESNISTRVNIEPLRKVF
jgi:hypothetical protein